MCLSREFWKAKACWKGNRKCSPRDKIEVTDGEEVCYLLWGNPIAVWNKTKNILKVNDCGWNSWLTFDRLNAILSHRLFYVYSVRGIHYLSNPQLNIEYKWTGTHTINLDTFKVEPCVARKTNPKASQALRKYYATATELVSERKFLVAQTLDETICLFPMLYGGNNFSLPVFGLYANNHTLRAYNREIARSKIYSAFMKNNPTPLSTYLTQNGHELNRQTILSTLKAFQVDINLLPAKIVQHLALMRLLED